MVLRFGESETFPLVFPSYLLRATFRSVPIFEGSTNREPLSLSTRHFPSITSVRLQTLIKKKKKKEVKKSNLI